MASSSKFAGHTCSNCPQSALHTCKACKAMPNATDGQVLSTWYCGPECQKAHWTEHKAQCKASQARQALYRAGATLQQMFYLFLKTSFMWNPGQIEKIGTTWFIHSEVYTGTSQVVPFPYERFPDVHDQQALLTYQSCNTALSEMHNVVKTLLNGLYSNVDEVSSFIKGAKHCLRQVYPGEGFPKIDATDYAHTVIRITTRNGESYALDMAGAQYGWDEPIMPWKLYTALKVREIREVVPFGQTKVFCKIRANIMGEQCKWIQRIHENFVENVEGGITWWQRGNISTSSLLRLPEQEFQKGQASLLDVVDQFLKLCKAIQESKGVFEVKEGFIQGAYGKDFTSAALGVISGRRSPSSGTT